MSFFINLSVIFWSLFPALMSYTQPASTPLKVELRQLVANSDLLIPKASPNENQPLGFTYPNATDITLTNGVVKFSVIARFGQMARFLPNLSGNVLYTFASFKADGNVRLTIGETVNVGHSGSNEFEFISMINTITNNSRYLSVSDYRSSGWTPIEVDYIGAINITDLVSNGCLPAGLSDLEYKTLLDNILFEIGGTFQYTYFYTETIADNYKWFSTGFVEKTGERDFIDYLGFFFWLSFPYLFAFALYKLLKGVIYG